MNVLLLLVLIIMWMVAVAVGLALFAAHRVKRRNRVSPKASSPAPTSWLASPSPAARMHRRLIASCRRSQTIAARPGASPQVGRLAGELETEALAIDDQLAIVAALPAADRRPRLGELAVKVRQVESLAQRLATAALPPDAVPGPIPEPVGLQKLAEELDAIEAARHEVERAERGDTSRR